MIATPLRGSLRYRLLLGTLFWIAISILVAGWGLSKLFEQHVEKQFYAELKTYLDQLTAQLVLDEKDRPALTILPGDPRLSTPFSGLYWQIDRFADEDFPTEMAMLRSRSLWDQTLKVPIDTPATGTIHQHQITGPENTPLRLIERSVQFEGQRLRLIVAANENLMVEPISRFKRELWLTLSILGIGLALAAFVQVFVGLAPLRSLQAALTRVRNGKSQKMEGTFPTELVPLVTEFNSVLTQNAEMVERARTQAGNLAHALKTPLSVLSNAAKLTEQDSDLANLVNSQVELARQQVDYHLARAQAAATVRRTGTRTSVQPVIKGLVRVMERIHAERNLKLAVFLPSTPLSFCGEEHDLQEMLGNLIDNACKWANNYVEIRGQINAQQLIITIDDDGKGITDSQRNTILRRGVRADQQVPGTGLGLAIVCDLVHLYEGKFELTHSPLGGLQAILTLPIDL